MSWCHAISGNVSQKSLAEGNTRWDSAPAERATASAYVRSSSSGYFQQDVKVRKRSPRAVA